MKKLSILLSCFVVLLNLSASESSNKNVDNMTPQKESIEKHLTRIFKLADEPLAKQLKVVRDKMGQLKPPAKGIPNYGYHLGRWRAKMNDLYIERRNVDALKGALLSIITKLYRINEESSGDSLKLLDKRSNRKLIRLHRQGY